MNKRTFLQTLIASSLSLIGFKTQAKTFDFYETTQLRTLTKYDKAIFNEFINIDIITDDGKSLKVPCIWGIPTQPWTPLIGINKIDESNYSVIVKTQYKEHMNQIFEQIVIKFNPTLKNNVGIYWLNNIASNNLSCQLELTIYKIYVSSSCSSS